MNIIIIFIQCIGVVTLGIGIWLYTTKNEYAVLTDGKYLLGSAFLVAVGFGVIIVGFLGIVAVIWESNIVASFVSSRLAHSRYTYSRSYTEVKCGPLNHSSVYRIAGKFRAAQIFAFFEGGAVNAKIKTGRNSHTPVFHMQSLWWVWFLGTEMINRENFF